MYNPHLDGNFALQCVRYRNVVEIRNRGLLHGTATNITLPISITWQSHVKNNDSSISCFDHIAMFDAPYHIKGGAQSQFLNAWISLYTKHV